MIEYLTNLTNSIASKKNTENHTILYSLSILLSTLSFEYSTGINWAALTINATLPVTVKITELRTETTDRDRSIDRVINNCSQSIVSKLAVNPGEGEKKLEITKPPVPRTEAVTYTHAHNDYEHEYPLVQALSHGFISVEADIWLFPDDEGNLRVAHFPLVEPIILPTLKELYLDPLQNLKEQLSNGGIYADGTPLILLIDIKSEGLTTYQRLNEILAQYEANSPGLLTTYTQDNWGNYSTTPGAVTIIVSGNRPRKFMESQKIRYAGYDGRKDDIGTDVAPDFMPLISDNWNNFFTDDLAWDGTGSIPEALKAKLNDLVTQVQQEQKIFRLWNLPQDAPNVWSPLYEAGVDLINTDDPEGLSHFIESDSCVAKNTNKLQFSVSN